ncbi:rhodanese/Cell cycle control phosphatase superfamily protein [Wolffia australiana]
MGIPACRGGEAAVFSIADCSFLGRRWPLPWFNPLIVPARPFPQWAIRVFSSGRFEALCFDGSLKRRRTAQFRSARRLSSSERDYDLQAAFDDFVVVNFYHFVHLNNPEAEVSNHLLFLQGRDIHGRIYINEQGINAQYSGPRVDAMAYVDWVKQDHRFCDVLVQISPSPAGHAFPRLRLRYKPSLVQLEGGSSHLPLVDPEMRATPLTPSEWKSRLQGTDEESPERKTLILDVRNGYEWDIGHFRGAQRPDVDCFRSTTFGQSESADSDPLAGVDKENTYILMYCTGGIRCDVYSTILREKGFKNLFTLSGGVSNYLRSEGPEEWVGNLFVFDSRLSLQPAAYNPETEDKSEENVVAFAKCYICQSPVNELRHRNCANLDCNLLFLCCSGCVEKMNGCCCSDCTTAPRLRPPLVGSQRYTKWHIYRDSKA